MTNDFSLSVKQSLGGDEYYSPQNVVDCIVPYIQKHSFKSVWCPFDLPDSKFVTTFQGLGYYVVHGHIFDGKDFFRQSSCGALGDCVVSNPPFSIRDKIFERLYALEVPFALVMNFNGLFDSKRRFDMFKRNGVQLLVPKGRMKFETPGKTGRNAPNFQSVYVCNKILDEQIVFADFEF